MNKSILILAIASMCSAMATAQTDDFCKACQTMDNSQRTAQIRQMFSECISAKNVVKKVYAPENDEFFEQYTYHYSNGKLIQITCETEIDYLNTRTYYIKDGCMFFCLKKDVHPEVYMDGDEAVTKEVEEFTRIYFCNGVAYKYLDADKKSVPVSEEYVKGVLDDLQDEYEDVLEWESKAQ
ncbi:MAG: hypothetical protein K6F33_03440 [Bacteroidales bacterium]|nr:hypothetical protein [Bacteroidales bacterium]